MQNKRKIIEYFKKLAPEEKIKMALQICRYAENLQKAVKKSGRPHRQGQQPAE